ncbi:GFA family protein [Roseobacter sp. EG26]|uniref:GFA family protein n=1 Tax=Roseobacter sp. EG26 TaxID=3412477 RepID=UPI002607E8D8|nr:GFA family protein [uncultured Roseobacter sp.]
MTGPSIINGRCLCGAVTVQAHAPKPILRACHCDMCRQHTSGMFISIATEQEGMVIDGPAVSFQSSEWAERGFCGTCGSTLWYGTKHDGARHLAAGLFEQAAGARLKLEFFSDMCPQGYGLKGDHRRLNTRETLEMFEGSEGDET